ncbi:predicted GPI-anchored protein 58 isoform X1 [Sphaeramia orbicularis]|uniref:predicted GPI-anchored protein 58 isoform X1 n=1 Tax=Sphaeramia orbicularis TaxID=375764 RepID=UPI00117BF2DD|nr:predicted GPI-anchored protein 58 isoform X1 [Sphaeramia orbicularis]
MLTRNVVLLFSLLFVLVKGDLDSNDAGIQAMSTDKDSTSDEAPTESMNAVSPDQPDESQLNAGGPSDSSSSSETPDAPAANQVTAPEPAAANSVEEDDDDDNSDSEEAGQKKISSRSAKPQSPALPPQSPAQVNQSPAQNQRSLAPIPQNPVQPIVPQPKSAVRNRSSKRRSRTGRRQI